MAKQHDARSARPDAGDGGRPTASRVVDLGPGMRVQGVFVVKKKVCREQPGGSRFLLFQFADRTGTINGVMWDRIDDVESGVAAGDLAHLTGDVQMYQNTRQVRVQRLVRADPAAYDLSDFLPTSRQDLDALYERLLAAVDAVGDPYLRRLYGELFRDPDVRQRFRCAPAGKGWHHAYVGGLLEHVTDMLQLGEVLARQHPELDRDLLVGGILLHDIGKIEELTFKSHIEYTNAGRLVGHLVQGCVLVSRFMDRIDGFPEELRTRVLHMIVSHHGAVDRGSPKPPMTLEATLVHLIDHLDSQAHGVEQVVARSVGDDGWSEHVKLLDRYFYRGSAERRTEGGTGGV